MIMGITNECMLVFICRHVHDVSSKFVWNVGKQYQQSTWLITMTPRQANVSPDQIRSSTYLKVKISRCFGVSDRRSRLFFLFGLH